MMNHKCIPPTRPIAAVCCVMLFMSVNARLSAGPATRHDVFVAADGNDANPGTRQRPFATLGRARDAARLLGTNQVRRIVVRGGKYYDVSLTLGPQDSGLTIEAAPGEQPILHGGRLVKGWKKDGEKFWAARLPGVKERTWDFRSLVVNGQLRPRARLPETGEFTHLTRFDARWHSTAGGGFRGADKPELKLGLKYRSGDLGPWLDVNNAELTIYHQWDDSLVGLKSHDPASQTLTFSTPAGYPPGAFGVRTYVVWNVREGMSRPGQWCLDRSRGMVVYWPPAGEDMGKVEAVAPAAESVIRIEGTKATPVTGVTLRGLGISATTTPLVAGGWAAGAFKGAVEVRFARDCRLLGLRVTGVGGQGIRQADCAGGLIEFCEVTESGAGGIYDARGVSGRIASNRIAGVGRTFTSAIGLRIAGGGQKRPELSHDNVIVNNEVRDCPYVGIEFDGWRNRFERNRVCDAMKVLRDGAAFYGAGRENVLRGNVVRGIPPGTQAHAYYIDELGEKCLVESNAAFDCEWPVHMHMAANNTVRNNLFVSSGPSLLTFPKCKGFTMDRNLVVAAGPIRVDHAAGVAAWTNNLFFSKTGPYQGVPDGERRAAPLFIAPEKGDYRFKPDSPAIKLGIKPLDVSDVGPRKESGK
jgi:hypothetical protein